MNWRIEYKDGHYYASIKRGLFWRKVERFVHLYGAEYDFATFDQAMKAIRVTGAEG